MSLRRNLLIAGVSLFLLLLTFTSIVIASNDNEATIALNEAEDLLNETFEVVRVAESNRVDVSGLSELLKDATQLLAQAYNSFRVGNFDRVLDFTNLVSEIGTDVKDTAQSLIEIKSDSSTKEKQDSLVESVIRIIIVIIIAFLCWSIFKKYYTGRKLVKKPEAAHFESK